MIKKLTFLALISTVGLPAVSFAQGLKIATVDMNRAFKEYNKTKDAESKINEAKNAAKKEYDDRADAYKKALDEINSLGTKLENPAISADAKSQTAKQRDEKIASVKNMEREITDFRQTREKQLQEQAVRMRDGIVKEITDVVLERVKSQNIDFVFDKSGVSLNGVPTIMYSRDNVDFTSDVVTALNKATPAEKSAGSDKPADKPAAAKSPSKP